MVYKWYILPIGGLYATYIHLPPFTGTKNNHWEFNDHFDSSCPSKVAPKKSSTLRQSRQASLDWRSDVFGSWCLAISHPKIEGYCRVNGSNGRDESTNNREMPWGVTWLTCYFVQQRQNEGDTNTSRRWCAVNEVAGSNTGTHLAPTWCANFNFGVLHINALKLQKT